MVKKLIIIFLMIGCIKNLYGSENCNIKCHSKINHSYHNELACTTCHIKNKKHYNKKLKFENSYKCFKCHKKYHNILNIEMNSRNREKKIIKSWFKNYDPLFFKKNCNSCHVTSCFSCHKISSKKITNNQCLSCHNSYFIGIEYIGLALKDDHKRYQTGVNFKGKYYMEMLPDVHFEKGLKCKDCHNMNSIANGEKSSKKCKDCHKKIDMTIIEHSIKEHITKLECYTCHSSWQQMEFGTFWIRFKNTHFKWYFRGLSYQKGDYVKSSFYKENGRPLFGINKRGKYSSIRPEFINFYTYIKENKAVGKENKLISNYFKAIFPHTIRRETVNCDYCHNSKKAYMHQDNESRIFFPEKDGLSITNFYNYKEFKMLNGRFINSEEMKNIFKKDKKYKRFYIKKVKRILNIFK